MENSSQKSLDLVSYVIDREQISRRLAYRVKRFKDTLFLQPLFDCHFPDSNNRKF